jgi:DNA-binding LytR/AlgR family response regulator
MTSCIIIEDEPLAAEKLQDYIQRMPELHLEKWIDNGKEAVAVFKQP